MRDGRPTGGDRIAALASLALVSYHHQFAFGRSLTARIFAVTSESKDAMKAIQIKNPGGPEAMELVDIPVPEPKPNEAVVTLAACGVNFIDVYQREGRYKVPL